MQMFSKKSMKTENQVGNGSNYYTPTFSVDVSCTTWDDTSIPAENAGFLELAASSSSSRESEEDIWLYCNSLVIVS